jgi:hypothetical protein
MSRLLSVTLAIYFLSASAVARQSTGQLSIPSQSTRGESQQVQPGQFLLRYPKVIPDLSFPPQFARIPLSSDIGKEIEEPEFKVINGAVYISIIESYLYIPMAGGGASGCLTLDLPEVNQITIDSIPSIRRR